VKDILASAAPAMTDVEFGLKLLVDEPSQLLGLGIPAVGFGDYQLPSQVVQHLLDVSQPLIVVVGDLDPFEI